MNGVGRTEVSFFWDDPETGVACKGRIDRMRRQHNRAWILDLKSTDDASKPAFTRSVVNYAYHRQADWYETGFAQASGLDVSPMLFVVIGIGSVAVLLLGGLLFVVLRGNRDSRDTSLHQPPRTPSQRASGCGPAKGHWL